ncbi:MAG: hypothetical protein H6667_12575 [Ardenticatenaceae bacterium]|nr:hypothetical protein [Ardenticatenaceae bacterium]MCB9443537.1 hypothetical protein [Ardenticatenaceae bacterium]
MNKSDMDERRKQLQKRPGNSPARVAPKPRVRPANRVVARRQTVAQRPMPAPPPRRPFQPAARPAPQSSVAANPELQTRLEQAQTSFASLESRAQLGDIYSTIGKFDSQLIDLPLALEALRERGYLHSEQLEDRLEALEARWDDVRPRVETTLQQHVANLDKQIDEVERHVHTLRPVEPSLRTAESVLKSLEQRIGAAETAVSSLYKGMDTDLYAIQADLNRITTMMDALAESNAIELRVTEGPLLAVKSVWQQSEKDGPEGMLFLTDQRLLFEQREEVVTKKRLGIFKAESEMIQELRLGIEVSDVDSIDAREEGGFLGMGKDDILELGLSANAPLARARFHLKGQDSADWAAVLKRIQTGEIDADRADEYVESLEEAQEAALSFPAQCPNCYAAVPTPPRGVLTATCEFCGTVIKPENPA